MRALLSRRTGKGDNKNLEKLLIAVDNTEAKSSPSGESLEPQTNIDSSQIQDGLGGKKPTVVEKKVPAEEKSLEKKLPPSWKKKSLDREKKSRWKESKYSFAEREWDAAVGSMFYIAQFRFNKIYLLKQLVCGCWVNVLYFAISLIQNLQLLLVF